MYHTTFDSKLNVWYGPKRVPLYNPNVSIGQTLLYVLEKHPNEIGQICVNNGHHLTNAEIRLNSIRAAQNLSKFGIRKGDVFGLFAKNTEHLAAVTFAALLIGAPVNALDPRFKKDEIQHMFKLTSPKIVCCDVENYEILVAALKELDFDVPIFTFGGTVDGSIAIEELFDETGDEDYFVAPDIGDGTKTIAFIICSSGTTGLSKGVSLSHAGVLYHLNLSAPMYGATLLSFSSLYWISGVSTLVQGTLCENLRIITNESFTPNLAFDLIEKYHVSAFISPSSSLALMLQHPRLPSVNLSALKYYLCAGSQVHDELIKSMNTYLENSEIYVGYGTSENGGCISNTYAKTRLGSVGQLTAGYRVKLVADNGDRCGIDEDGEIYARSAYPFVGYYGNAESLKECVDEDGYFRTGDIGRFDADGYLYIVGRKKEVIKYRNSQISPAEIENVIMLHKNVEMTCVAGVPDLVCTDLPAALVVKSKYGMVSSNEILEIVKEKLSDAKQLRGGIYFVDSLPMTASGKIIRREVTEIVTRLYRENWRQ